jgi:hypothetical protein
MPHRNSDVFAALHQRKAPTRTIVNRHVLLHYFQSINSSQRTGIIFRQLMSVLGGRMQTEE